MPRIGGIDIGYNDPKLIALLKKVQKTQPLKNPMRGLSGYLLPEITLDALRRDNYVCTYDYGSGVRRPEITGSNAADMDEILFTKGEDEIGTGASCCLSLILSCKPMELAVAAHSGPLCTDNASVQKQMFLYSFANLKKLAGTNPIWAYISGCYPAGQESVKEDNFRLFSVLLPEILRRGVTVKFFGIGRYYGDQTLKIKPGIYSSSLFNPDPRSIDQDT